MSYDLVRITLREVPPKKYTAIIGLIVELGLYDQASVTVEAAVGCEK